MNRILPFAAVLTSITNAAFSYNLSEWATEDYIRLSSGGILYSELLGEELKDNITREEFCTLITNIYEADMPVVLSEEDKGVFPDTDSEAVLKAHKLGIVSGRDDGEFHSDDAVTRQEMAVMISRALKLLSDSYDLYSNQVLSFTDRFFDSSEVDSWALEDMAAVCEFGIINGNEAGLAEPKMMATREQAICMLSRVYKEFVKNQITYQIPSIVSFSQTAEDTHKIDLVWSYTPNVADYKLIVKQSGGDSVVIDIPKEDTSISGLDTGIGEEYDISVYVAAYLNSGAQIFSLPVLGEGTGIFEEQVPETNTEQEAEEEIVVKDIPLDEKEARVFPDGHYFESSEEASEHMTEVAVPVWTLKSDGTKVSSKKYLTVNQALAEDVVNIFTEIYNDPSQFPIKDVGGYSWRQTAGGSISQHSYGTCIDINYNENYYVRPDGTPITGSYWRPGEDPYSIAEDSIVVKTFAKYGWKWGGNAWSESNPKDYMHFTYLGR